MWDKSYNLVPMNDGMAQGRLRAYHVRWRNMWRDPRARALLPRWLRVKVTCHPRLARAWSHARTTAFLARALAHVRGLRGAYPVDELVLEREIAHYACDGPGLEAAREGFLRLGFTRLARETQQDYIDGLAALASLSGSPTLASDAASPDGGSTGGGADGPDGPDGADGAGNATDDGHPARHHHAHAASYLVKARRPRGWGARVLPWNCCK